MSASLLPWQQPALLLADELNAPPPQPESPMAALPTQPEIACAVSLATRIPSVFPKPDWEKLSATALPNERLEALRSSSYKLSAALVGEGFLPETLAQFKQHAADSEGQAGLWLDCRKKATSAPARQTFGEGAVYAVFLSSRAKAFAELFSIRGSAAALEGKIKELEVFNQRVSAASSGGANPKESEWQSAQQNWDVLKKAAEALDAALAKELACESDLKCWGGSLPDPTLARERFAAAKALKLELSRLRGRWQATGELFSRRPAEPGEISGRLTAAVEKQIALLPEDKRAAARAALLEAQKDIARAADGEPGDINAIVERLFDLSGLNKSQQLKALAEMRQEAAGLQQKHGFDSSLYTAAASKGPRLDQGGAVDDLKLDAQAPARQAWWRQSLERFGAAFSERAKKTEAQYQETLESLKGRVAQWKQKASGAAKLADVPDAEASAALRADIQALLKEFPDREAELKPLIAEVSEAEGGLVEKRQASSRHAQTAAKKLLELQRVIEAGSAIPENDRAAWIAGNPGRLRQWEERKRAIAESEPGERPPLFYEEDALSIRQAVEGVERALAAAAANACDGVSLEIRTLIQATPDASAGASKAQAKIWAERLSGLRKVLFEDEPGEPSGPKWERLAELWKDPRWSATLAGAPAAAKERAQPLVELLQALLEAGKTPADLSQAFREQLIDEKGGLKDLGRSILHDRESGKARIAKMDRFLEELSGLLGRLENASPEDLAAGLNALFDNEKYKGLISDDSDLAKLRVRLTQPSREGGALTAQRGARQAMKSAVALMRKDERTPGAEILRHSFGQYNAFLFSYLEEPGPADTSAIAADAALRARIDEFKARFENASESISDEDGQEGQASLAFLAKEIAEQLPSFKLKRDLTQSVVDLNTRLAKFQPGREEELERRVETLRGEKQALERFGRREEAIAEKSERIRAAQDAVASREAGAQAALARLQAEYKKLIDGDPASSDPELRLSREKMQDAVKALGIGGRPLAEVEAERARQEREAVSELRAARASRQLLDEASKMMRAEGLIGPQERFSMADLRERSARAAEWMWVKNARDYMRGLESFQGPDGQKKIEEAWSGLRDTVLRDMYHGDYVPPQSLVLAQGPADAEALAATLEQMVDPNWITTGFLDRARRLKDRDIRGLSPWDQQIKQAWRGYEALLGKLAEMSEASVPGLGARAKLFADRDPSHWDPSSLSEERKEFLKNVAQTSPEEWHRRLSYMAAHPEEAQVKEVVSTFRAYAEEGVGDADKAAKLAQLFRDGAALKDSAVTMRALREANAFLKPENQLPIRDGQWAAETMASSSGRRTLAELAEAFTKSQRDHLFETTLQQDNDYLQRQLGTNLRAFVEQKGSGAGAELVELLAAYENKEKRENAWNALLSNARGALDQQAGSFLFNADRDLSLNLPDVFERRHDSPVIWIKGAHPDLKVFLNDARVQEYRQVDARQDSGYVWAGSGESIAGSSLGRGVVKKVLTDDGLAVAFIGADGRDNIQRMAAVDGRLKTFVSLRGKPGEGFGANIYIDAEGRQFYRDPDTQQLRQIAEKDRLSGAELKRVYTHLQTYRADPESDTSKPEVVVNGTFFSRGERFKLGLEDDESVQRMVRTHVAGKGRVITTNYLANTQFDDLGDGTARSYHLAFDPKTHFSDPNSGRNEDRSVTFLEKDPVTKQFEAVGRSYFRQATDEKSGKPIEGQWVPVDERNLGAGVWGVYDGAASASRSFNPEDNRSWYGLKDPKFAEVMPKSIYLSGVPPPAKGDSPLAKAQNALRERRLSAAAVVINNAAPLGVDRENAAAMTEALLRKRFAEQDASHDVSIYVDASSRRIFSTLRAYADNGVGGRVMTSEIKSSALHMHLDEGETIKGMMLFDGAGAMTGAFVPQGGQIIFQGVEMGELRYNEGNNWFTKGYYGVKGTLLGADPFYAPKLKGGGGADINMKRIPKPVDITTSDSALLNLWHYGLLGIVTGGPIVDSLAGFVVEPLCTDVFGFSPETTAWVSGGFKLLAGIALSIPMGAGLKAFGDLNKYAKLMKNVIEAYFIGDTVVGVYHAVDAYRHATTDDERRNAILGLVNVAANIGMMLGAHAFGGKKKGGANERPAGESKPNTPEGKAPVDPAKLGGELGKNAEPPPPAAKPSAPPPAEPPPPPAPKPPKPAVPATPPDVSPVEIGGGKPTSPNITPPATTMPPTTPPSHGGSPGSGRKAPGTPAFDGGNLSHESAGTLPSAGGGGGSGGGNLQLGPNKISVVGENSSGGRSAGTRPAAPGGGAQAIAPQNIARAPAAGGVRNPASGGVVSQPTAPANKGRPTVERKPAGEANKTPEQKVLEPQKAAPPAAAPPAAPIEAPAGKPAVRLETAPPEPAQRPLGPVERKLVAEPAQNRAPASEFLPEPAAPSELPTNRAGAPAAKKTAPPREGGEAPAPSAPETRAPALPEPSAPPAAVKPPSAVPESRPLKPAPVAAPQPRGIGAERLLFNAVDGIGKGVMAVGKFIGGDRQPGKPAPEVSFLAKLNPLRAIGNLLLSTGHDIADRPPDVAVTKAESRHPRLGDRPGFQEAAAAAGKGRAKPGQEVHLRLEADPNTGAAVTGADGRVKAAGPDAKASMEVKARRNADGTFEIVEVKPLEAGQGVTLSEFAQKHHAHQADLALGADRVQPALRKGFMTLVEAKAAEIRKRPAGERPERFVVEGHVDGEGRVSERPGANTQPVKLELRWDAAADQFVVAGHKGGAGPALARSLDNMRGSAAVDAKLADPAALKTLDSLMRGREMRRELAANRYADADGRLHTEATIHVDAQGGFHAQPVAGSKPVKLTLRADEGGRTFRVVDSSIAKGSKAELSAARVLETYATRMGHPEAPPIAVIKDSLLARILGRVVVSPEDAGAKAKEKEGARKQELVAAHKEFQAAAKAAAAELSALKISGDAKAYARRAAELAKELEPAAKRYRRAGGPAEHPEIAAAERALDAAAKEPDPVKRRAAVEKAEDGLRRVHEEGALLRLGDAEAAAARGDFLAARAEARAKGVDVEAVDAQAQYRQSARQLREAAAAESDATARLKEAQQDAAADGGAIDHLQAELSKAQVRRRAAESGQAQAEARLRGLEESGAAVSVKAEAMLDRLSAAQERLLRAQRGGTPDEISRRQAEFDAAKAELDALPEADARRAVEMFYEEGLAAAAVSMEHAQPLRETLRQAERTAGEADARLAEMGVDPAAVEAAIERSLKINGETKAAAELLSELSRSPEAAAEAGKARIDEQHLAVRERGEAAERAAQDVAQAAAPKNGGSVEEALRLVLDRKAARIDAADARMTLDSARRELARAMKDARRNGLDAGAARARAEFIAKRGLAVERAQAAELRQSYRYRGMTAEQANAAASLELRVARGKAGRNEGAGEKVVYQGDANTCSIHSLANHLAGLGLKNAKGEPISFSDLVSDLYESMGERFVQKLVANGLSVKEMDQANKFIALKYEVTVRHLDASQVFSALAKGQDVMVTLNVGRTRWGQGGGPHRVNLKGGSLKTEGRETTILIADSLVKGKDTIGDLTKVRVVDAVDLLARGGGTVIEKIPLSRETRARYETAAGELARKYTGERLKLPKAPEPVPAISPDLIRPENFHPGTVAPLRGPKFAGAVMEAIERMPISQAEKVQRFSAIMAGAHTEAGGSGLWSMKHVEANAADLARNYAQAIMGDHDGFGNVSRYMEARYGASLGSDMTDAVARKMLAHEAEVARQVAGPDGVVAVRPGGDELFLLVRGGRGAAVAEAVRQAGRDPATGGLRVEKVIAEVFKEFNIADSPREAVRQIQDRAWSKALEDFERKGGERPIEADVRDRIGTTSLGVSEVRPGEGAHAYRDLLDAKNRADEAQAAAKSQGGKDRVAVELPEGGARILERRTDVVTPDFDARVAARVAKAFDGSAAMAFETALKSLPEPLRKSILEERARDHVTSLDTRESVLAEVDRMLHEARSGNLKDPSLYHFELLNFKPVNDARGLGHAAGDVGLAALGKTAKEVQAELAAKGVKVAIAGRMAGNEFGVFGSKTNVEIFRKAFESRLSDGKVVMDAIAEDLRARWKPGQPAEFQKITGEGVARLVREQADATGKDARRVGAANGRIVALDVEAPSSRHAYEKSRRAAVEEINGVKTRENADYARIALAERRGIIERGLTEIGAAEPGPGLERLAFGRPERRTYRGPIELEVAGRRLEIVSIADLALRQPELAATIRARDASVGHVLFDPADPFQLKGLREGQPFTLGVENPGRFHLPAEAGDRHLRITREGEAILIEDLGAPAGTRISPEAPPFDLKELRAKGYAIVDKKAVHEITDVDPLEGPAAQKIEGGVSPGRSSRPEDARELPGFLFGKDAAGKPLDPALHAVVDLITAEFKTADGRPLPELLSGPRAAELRGKLLRKVYDVIDATLPYDAAKVAGFGEEYLALNKALGKRGLGADQQLVLLIGEVVRRQAGVCRHQGLLAAGILQHLTDTGLLQGRANYVRVPGHGYATYTTSAGDVVRIDVAQHKFFKIGKEAGRDVVVADAVGGNALGTVIMKAPQPHLFEALINEHRGKSGALLSQAQARDLIARARAEAGAQSGLAPHAQAQALSAFLRLMEQRGLLPEGSAALAVKPAPAPFEARLGGEKDGRRFVEELPAFRYQGPVSLSAGAAQLQLSRIEGQWILRRVSDGGGKPRVITPEKPYRIGRELADNNYALPSDKTLSAKHFELLIKGDYITIRDLGSKGGTRVRYERAEIGAAETRPESLSERLSGELGKYFDAKVFLDAHHDAHHASKGAKVYHNWEHSLRVAEMAYDIALKRAPERAKFIREVALLHDFDPGRDPGLPARVPETLKRLRLDFENKLNLDGAEAPPGGEVVSVLKQRFGWNESQLRMAEAMIQRTEFPFGDAHNNPHYKETSPVKEYERMLRLLSPEQRANVLQDSAILSEYADKSSWYATETFDGAFKVVEGLVNEINGAARKSVVDMAKLDTADFLAKVGAEESFALDRALAGKFLKEGALSAEQHRAIEFPLLDAMFSQLPEKYARVFAANVEGFNQFKAALSRGENVLSAKAIGELAAQKKLAEADAARPIESQPSAAEAGVAGLAQRAVEGILGERRVESEPPPLDGAPIPAALALEQAALAVRPPGFETAAKLVAGPAREIIRRFGSDGADAAAAYAEAAQALGALGHPVEGVAGSFGDKTKMPRIARWPESISFRDAQILDKLPSELSPGQLERLPARVQELYRLKKSGKLPSDLDVITKADLNDPRVAAELDAVRERIFKERGVYIEFVEPIAPPASAVRSPREHQAEIAKAFDDLPKARRQAVSAKLDALIAERGEGKVLFELAELFVPDAQRPVDFLGQRHLKKLLSPEGTRQQKAQYEADFEALGLPAAKRLEVLEVFGQLHEKLNAPGDRARILAEVLAAHEGRIAPRDLLAAMKVVFSAEAPSRETPTVTGKARENAALIIDFVKQLKNRAEAIGPGTKVISLLGDGEVFYTAKRSLWGEKADEMMRLEYVSRKTVMTASERAAYDEATRREPGLAKVEGLLDQSEVYRTLYAKDAAGVESGLMVEARRAVLEDPLKPSDPILVQELFQTEFQRLLEAKLQAEPNGAFATQVRAVYDGLKLGDGNILVIDSGFKGTFPTLIAAMHRIVHPSAKAQIHLFGVSKEFAPVVPGEHSRNKAKNIDYAGKFAELSGVDAQGRPLVGMSSGLEQLRATVQMHAFTEIGAAEGAGASKTFRSLDVIEAVSQAAAKNKNLASNPNFFKVFVRELDRSVLPNGKFVLKSSDGPARGGVKEIAAAQEAFKSRLLEASRRVAREQGLKPEEVISHGTTLSGLVGMIMTGGVEATTSYKGFSGESAHYWGAQGLEVGAQYGGGRAVYKGQPGVSILMRGENPDNPLRVVQGETLNRKPLVKEDFIAAVITDGERTTVLERDALRALAASAQSWKAEINVKAQKGDMKSFEDWTALEERIIPR